MANLPKLSPQVIKAYQDDLAKNSSPATAKRKAISLNRFFDWATDQGHIPANPMAPADPPAQSDIVVVTPKKKSKVDAGTWAILGLTGGIVVIIFLLIAKVKLPIPFTINFAQESNIQTASILPSPSSVPGSIPSNSAVIASWNLYAKLKLTSESGAPQVGTQTLGFKIYNTETGGTALYTSDPQSITTDSNGSALISLVGVPTNLFFQNEKLYLEPEISGQPAPTARILVPTASVAQNLNEYPPANPDTGAGPLTIPVLDANGSLNLAGQSPAVNAKAGNLLIQGQAVTIKTADGSGGNIEINPDANGYAHFLFEGNRGNFLNAQAPNLTSGSLFYGMVPNNATGYDLIKLQNGAPRMTTKFSVDALGNTTTAGFVDAEGGIATQDIYRITPAGALVNITGYQQNSGNFIINQQPGDFASINKTLTSGSALSDVLTLTLDERGKPATSNSDYSTLVLNRYDGGNQAMALLVNNGNAQFNGNVFLKNQLQLGNFSSLPTAVGSGSIIYNSSDNQVYFWNGSSWVPVGTASTVPFSGITTGTNTTATMTVGSGATLTFSGTGVVNASQFNGLTSNEFLRADANSNLTSGNTLTTNSGSTLNIAGGLELSGSAGTTGQLLTSQGAGNPPTWNNIASFLSAGTDISITGTTTATISDTSTLNSVTGRGNTTSNSITVGNLTATGTTTFGGLTYTWPATQSNGFVLSTNGSGTLSWSDPNSLIAATQFWNQTAGALYPKNNTVDLLVGSDSTTSAKFAFTGVNGGLPTASIAGNVAGVSTYLTGNGNLSTTNAQDLTLGSSTTGNVILNSRGTNALTVNGANTTLAGTLTFPNTNTLTGIANYLEFSQGIQVDSGNINTGAATGNIFTGSTTINLGGSGVALTLGGNGTIYGGTNAGGTLTLSSTNNGTQGNIQFFSSANTISPAGNLTIAGTTTFNGLTYTWPSTQTAGYVLQTNGAGVLSWVNPTDAVASQLFWNQANGALFPKNNTVDVLIGSGATSSAKFAFTGVNGGLPTASIAGNIANVATFIDGNGNISTTNGQNLILGNSATYNSTGNVLLNPSGIGNVGIGTSAPLAKLAIQDSTIDTGNVLTATSSALTSGNLADFIESGAQNFSGNALQLNIDAGGSGSAFTGNFLNFLNAGSVKFRVDNQGNIITPGNAAINGGNITTTASTGNLFTSPSTINLGTSATTVSIGGGSGTTTVNNNLSVNGGTLTTNQTTFNLINSTATTLNIGGGASSVINVGPTGASGSIALSGGSGDTGCTLDGTTGNFSCSGNITGTGSTQGFWTQALGALFPTNNSVDLLVGSSATSTAKFAFTGVNGGLPTASIAGNIANVATFLTGNGNLSTTNAADLTLGGSTTGNVILNSRGSNALTVNGANTTLAGTLTLPNTNTLTGIANYVEFSQGIQIDSGTINTTNTSASIFDSNATTVSLGGSATTALNIGNGNGGYAAINIGSGTGGNTINIGTGGTATNTITLGNASSATNIVLSKGPTGNLTFTGYNCSADSNGGKLTTDASGNVVCAGDVSSTSSAAVRWSDLTDPNANLTLNMATYSSTFNWNTTQALDAMTWNFINNANPAGNENVFSIVNGVTANTTDNVTESLIHLDNADTAVSGSTVVADAILVSNSGGITGGITDAFDASAVGITNAINIGANNIAGTNFNVTGSNGNVTAGNIAVNGGSITTNQTTFNLVNTTATTINFGGGASTVINIGPTGASGSIALSGGSGDTGCTLDGTTGNFSCSGNISGTGTTQGFWTQALGAIYPTNNTVDLLVGAGATSSAKFAFTGVNSGTPTASIAGTVANVALYMTGNGNISTTNAQDLTLGSSTTGNVILNSRGTNTLTANGSDVTIAGNLAVNGGSLTTSSTTANVFNANATTLNIGGGATTTINVGPTGTAGSIALSGGSGDTGCTLDGTTGNFVCSGSITSTSTTGTQGFWTQNLGALYPTNSSVDVLFGSNATSSAKFAFTGVNGGLPTASVSGDIANVATYLNGDGNLSTTNAQNLTLGSSTTGNVILNSRGFNALTANGSNVNLIGVLTLPNSNSLTGLTDFVQFSNGLEVGGGTTFFFDKTGNINANNVTGSILNATTSVNTGAGTGTPRIDASGNLTNIGTTQFHGLTYTWPTTQSANFILQTDGAGVLSWVDPNTVAASTIYWTQANGALFPKNNSVDVLIGSNATSSAKFAFTGVNGGLPTASIAGNIANVATYLTGDGNLSTTNAQDLTLGSLNTGNVIINSRGTNAVTVNGANTTLAGTLTLPNSNTLTGLSNFVQFTNGIEVGGGSTFYFDKTGNINANNVVASLVNATTSINTGAGTGTPRIDASGNLTNIGTTQLNGVTYTWPAASTANFILQAQSSGTSTTLSWVDPNTVASATQFWDQQNGALYPKNNTVDLLIGANSTGSAKFAFTGVNGGLPTASIAGDLANVSTYLTGDGVLSTTNAQNLTIGSVSTGDVFINSRGSSALKASGNNLTAFGTLTMPSSNTLTGVTNYLQLSQGISVGGAITFHIDASGNVVANDVAANSGNLTTTAATGNLFNSATTVNLGTSSTAVNIGGTGTTTINNSLAVTGDTNLNGNSTFGNATSDNITFTGRVNSSIIPAANNTYDLGSNTGPLQWNNVYANAFFQNGFGVCDSSGFNCPAGSGFWALLNKVLYPANQTYDLAIGGNSTASAKFHAYGIETSGGNIASLTSNTITTGDVLSATASAITSGNILKLGEGGDQNFNGNVILADIDNTGSGGTGFTGDFLKFNNANSTVFTVNSLGSLTGNAGTFAGNVAVNGGNLTTTATTANLFTNATTLGIGNAAGTTTINGTIDVAGNTTLGTNTSNTITFLARMTSNIVPATTDLYNIGTSSSLEFNNIFAKSFTQNGFGVCDASGLNCPSGSSLWSQANGALYPTNNTVDVLIGANSTASAKFAFTGVNGGLPTASIAGNIANVATFIDGNGNISTTNRENLTLGNSATYNSTGNILINSNGTGNVGIGTTAPLQKLQIGTNTSVGTTTPDAISLGATYSTVAGDDLKLRLYDTGSGIPIGLGVSANQLDYEVFGGASHVWYVGGIEKARLDANGNFGIGTSPTAKLDVKDIAATTGNVINATASAITSGNILKLGEGGDQTFNGNVILADIDNTGGGGGAFTGNFVRFDNASSTKFTVDASGNTVMAGNLNVNGGTIQTASGNLFLQPAGAATTAHVQIGSGAGSATPDLLVLDVKNTAGDPTGTNGAMYYNTTTNTMRCFVNGTWQDCGTGSGSATDNWTLDSTNGTLHTTIPTVDVLIGSNSTASAKFAFMNVDSATLPPTASIAGNIANVATYIDGNGNISTTNAQGLTLGSSTTGNVTIDSRGSTALTANGANLTVGGTVAFPNSNTLTGVVGYVQNSLGYAVGGNTTYHFDSNGDLVAHNVAVNNGNLTTTASTLNAFTANATTINLGILNSGLVNIGGGSTSNGCTFNDSNGNLTCAGNIVSNATSGTNGWWQLNGLVLSPSNSTYDLAIGGTATGSAFQVFGAPTTSGDRVKVTSSQITSGNVIEATASAITTGNILKLAEGGDQQFSGNVILADIDNTGSGGTGFTGRFLEFKNATVEQFYVDAFGNVVSNGNGTFANNLNVNGGSIATTQTGTANIFNTNATTLNIGGAASNINMGALAGALTLGGNSTINGGANASGTLTLDSTTNATKGNINFFSTSNFLTPTGNLTIAGDLTANGNDILTNTAAAATVFNTNATSLSMGGAATAINLLGASSATIDIGNSGGTTALNLTSGTGAQTFTSSNASGTTTAASFVFNDTAMTNGDFIYGNAGSGSFTGDFAKLANNSVIQTTIDATGNISTLGVLQTGSASHTLAYNRLGTATALTSAILSANGDILVSGNEELQGGLYLSNSKTIFNVVGGVSTGAITLATDPAALNNFNSLTYGSWVVDNTTNNGMAALMVNQGSTLNDIFDASTGGQTKFTIANNGDTSIGPGGLGKLTTGTVDPPYTINGSKYATYVPGMTGVKEEVTGNIATNEYVPGKGYRSVIDFNSLPEGSDLWLFGKATNIKENINDLVALLTPSDDTRTWYEVDKANSKLAFYSSRPTDISYRLTGPRFDYVDHPNQRMSSVEGFVLNIPDVVNNNEIATTIQNMSDYIITKVSDGIYTVKDSSGTVIDGIESVGNFVAANIKAGAIQTQELSSNTINAIASLVTPNVKTDLISPVPGNKDIAIQIGTATESGKLAIQNANGNEVASIDDSGNATFSGTVKSQNIDQIQALLTQVTADQSVLSQIVGQQISTTSANLSNLITSDLYVTNQAAINSLSVTNSIALGTAANFVIGSDGTINSLSNPLKLQSMAMAPVEIMAGLVKIDTNGNVQIAGDLNVAGRVKSSGLTLKDNSSPDSLLTLQNSTGVNVATVDASGSASFNTLQTQGLTIAGATEASSSALVNGTITTNSTVGSAVIPAGTSEITIKNPKVTDYSLVYVTPTSSTNNYVLYVKSKVNGQFVVGFDQPLSADVNFNWWIVQVQN